MLLTQPGPDTNTLENAILGAGAMIACAIWVAFRFARVRGSRGGGHARGEVTAVLEELRKLGPPAGSKRLSELAEAITTVA